MNNKIALKLTLYFSAVLLVFALIIGGVFYQFFKQQTVEIKEKEMRLRAEKIAEVLGDNMARMESRHGDGIANSKFISYLDNVTHEQREKAVEKMRKERKEAHEKYAKETMARLTPGQKAEVQQFIKDDMAQRKARHERLQHMTPEQREAIRANRPLPPKPPKHHKGEYRGYKHHKEEFHGYRHHNGEFPQPPQD
jgi:hypothetical protein